MAGGITIATVGVGVGVGAIARKASVTSASKVSVQTVSAPKANAWRGSVLPRLVHIPAA